MTPKVAAALGAGDVRRAGSIAVQALWLAAGLGAVMTVLGLAFAEPIARGLGAQSEVLRFAEPYLRIRALSAIPVLVTTVAHGWLRGAHDTRTPMLIVGIGAALNVVLDYVLIYPVGWGVPGAAWATVIGQTGAAAALVLVLLKRVKAPDWRVDGPTVRALLSVGLDLVIRTGILRAALTVATAVAARMGVLALASWEIAMQVFFLLAFLLDSVAIAAQALVARRLGAGEVAAATDVSRRLMAWGVMLGIALCVILLPAARPIASMFSDDRSVVDAAAQILVWVALMQPLSAVAFTLDGILIGAADTRFLAGAMIVASGAFVPVAFISLGAGWGTAGLGAGLALWLTLRAVVTGRRFSGGRWAVQPS